MKTANKHRQIRLRVTESCRSHVTPRIDTEAGVIHDVLIVGLHGRNRRHYTRSALEEAARRYEGKPIYIAHKKGRGTFVKRTAHEHGGELRDVYVAKDGLRAKVLYNRSSDAGKLVLEVAQRFPKQFGFSHHADVAGYQTETGEKIITEILEVHSVDLVKDPATTDSVFEEEEVTSGPSVADALVALQTAIHSDSSMDDDTKLKNIKAVMKLKKQILGEGDGDGDGEGDDDGSAEEAVDVKALLKRIEALESAKAKPRVAPKSAARSTVTEDVTPAAPKPKMPTTAKEVLAAYDCIN